MMQRLRCRPLIAFTTRSSTGERRWQLLHRAIGMVFFEYLAELLPEFTAIRDEKSALREWNAAAGFSRPVTSTPDSLILAPTGSSIRQMLQARSYQSAQ